MYKLTNKLPGCILCTIFMYNDKTFKHGQMAAILFMQMRWSIFIYELLEPQTALE